MRTKYRKPSTSVFYVQEQQHLLTGSLDGINARISGYDADTNGGGFSQNPPSGGTKMKTNPVDWD